MISKDSDLETSVTTISVIGFLLLLVMLKFISCARPAIIVTSEASLPLGLFPASSVGEEPVIIEARITLS
jgi:hypothetical protein